MSSATIIRPLARALDACEAPFWVIDPKGKLIYLSQAATGWLGSDGEQLVGRRSIAGASVSEDPLDYLAASLAPPPEFHQRGVARLRVHPVRSAKSSEGGGDILPIEVRYLRLGDPQNCLTLAVAGEFDDAFWVHRQGDLENADAVATRQQLDQWRAAHESRALIVTAGTSSAAKRFRQRIRVACEVRTHFGIYGPPGCDSESVARYIHRRSTNSEPVAVVDGPLMDAELLDASLATVIEYLARVDSGTPQDDPVRATALIRGLDEMPIDAQLRLRNLTTSFDGRLRLIGLCKRRPSELTDPQDLDSISPTEDLHQEGLLESLADLLSPLSLELSPLAERAEDIPMLAAALVDQRRASGDGRAERVRRAALDKMVTYPWPGNFQELDEAVRHATRLCTGDAIAAEHLPLAVRSYQASSPGASQEFEIDLDQWVQRYERKLIEFALESAGGNRAQAARQLGISRARLLRKLDSNEDGGDS